MIITALYGKPTEHSVSPQLFSFYAKHFRLEYSHLKIDIKKAELENAIKSVRLLKFAGVNITLPYKQDVIAYLDKLDSTSKQLGAVNTIVNKNGILIGYNTDWYGAVKQIETLLSRKISNSDKALVIGTGGAARAVIFGLLKYTSNITVMYRNPASVRTISIKKSFLNKVKFLKIESDKIAIHLNKANIIFNTTSCGMKPNYNDSIFSKEFFMQNKKLINGKYFFDSIFNPKKTKFLTLAENNGAKVLGGIDWMVYQGVKAFQLWTGKKIPIKLIKPAKNILERLL